jgi:hypothetical protein
MKTTTVKTFGNGIAALALMLVLATSARASLVIQQVSAPVFTGSWSVNFLASGVTFDKITGTIVSGGPFEIPGLTLPPFPPPPSGWNVVLGGTTTVASLSGPATSFLLYTATFTGLPADLPPVALDFSVYDSGTLVGATTLTWNGSEFDVPEPTTIVAGALLLLPFGASTIRILRKQNRAA